MAFASINFWMKLMAKYRSISFGIIVAISVLMIAANYFTIRITSAVRAYINGESRYSKGQTDATVQLILFLDSRDTVHWKSFLTEIEIPIGDSIARVTLENSGSLEVIKRGFIQGENHPDDLDDMIWLFQKFRKVPFMKRAIQIWKEGDFLIGQLYSEGVSSHQKIISDSFSEEDKKSARIRIDFHSSSLIKKEQEFSDVLGSSARKINRYLFGTNIVLILVIISTAGRYVIITIGALRQSEERFKLLYNKTPVMMHSVEADGKLSRVSDFWLEKMGYTRNEVLGRHATDFLTEESRDKAITKILPEFFRSGDATNIEYDFVTKAGKILNTLLSANGERDEQGRVIRSLSVVTDISETKRLMVSLELAHKSARLGIWQIDFTNNSWEGDENLKEMFGIEAGILSQEEYWSIIHPDEIEDKIKRDRLFLQSDRVDYHDEYRIVRPIDHEIRYIKSQGILFRDKQGNPQKGVSVVFDQTSEKLAQKNLQLKSFTIEHSSDPIFWIRPDGSFADVNPAAYQSLGYSLEEILSLKVPDIDFNYNKEVWPLHWQELREKGVMKFPSTQRKKDGTSIDVEIIANYIIFEGQEFNCAIIRDVTERKKSEAALLLQFEELQKINHELDRFVYSVSHDLRAPLASLLGLINVAELEKPSPTFHSYLLMMRQSINRLDRFIRDILDYSRNARQEVQFEKIDFNDMLTEVQNNLGSISGFERLKIKVNLFEEAVFYSDRSRIGILLNNLFSNAIKYQDVRKNSSFLIIDIVSTSREAIIKFSDNGIGIEKSHMSKIFEMFYRATEEAKGSGLGLYIAKETVAKLKGDITVQSELSKGTTFEIHIPNSTNTEIHNN